MSLKIGFVGLGNIGAPMCRHLLEHGYEVIVHDADPQAVRNFSSSPTETASSPDELARLADVVVLSLPNSAVVEQVVLGDRGLAEGLSRGDVLIDTSSSKPTSTQLISDHLAKKEVHTLDAPVSGGSLRAKEGTLAIMVGGEKAVLERCHEVLSSFGKDIFHVGGVGAGHLTKAINNLVSATTLASAAEAVLLGVRAGLAPEALIEVLNASSGRSNSTEVKFPHYILNRSFDDGFGIALMNKDLKIALDTASELEHPMTIGPAVGQLWQAAVDQGFGSDSHTAIYKFLEELTEKPDEATES